MKVSNHHYKRNHHLKQTGLLFLLLLLSSCAPKPWGDLLLQDSSPELFSTVESLLTKQYSCHPSWDADILVQYETALETRKFSGYILVSQPSAIKFIASNPLGQPILAITTNGNDFQLMDVLNQQFTRGSTRSYGLHEDIPVGFISGQWGNWLTAKPDLQPPYNIREDIEERGIWVGKETENVPGSYYLLNYDTLQVKEQLLLDEKKKILARFTYSNFPNNDLCSQPREITISELPFRSTITLQFSRIQDVDNPDQKDFILKVPQHYFIKLLP